MGNTICGLSKNIEKIMKEEIDKEILHELYDHFKEMNEVLKDGTDSDELIRKYGRVDKKYKREFKVLENCPFFHRVMDLFHECEHLSEKQRFRLFVKLVKDEEINSGDEDISCDMSSEDNDTDGYTNEFNSQMALQICRKFKNKGLDFESFATLWAALSSFTKDTKDGEKLKLAFDFYDIDKDGFITREEMFEILKMVYFTESDDGVDLENNFKSNRKLCLKIIKQTIDIADANNDGKISFEEFCDLCLKNGDKLGKTIFGYKGSCSGSEDDSEEVRKEAKKKYGSNDSDFELNSDDFDFEDFLLQYAEAAKKMQQDPCAKENLKKAFHLFDMSKNGYITKMEMFAVVKVSSMGFLDDDEIEKAVAKTIKIVDKDGDGKISFDEFCDLYLNHRDQVGRTVFQFRNLNSGSDDW